MEDRRINFDEPELENSPNRSDTRLCDYFPKRKSHRREIDGASSIMRRCRVFLGYSKAVHVGKPYLAFCD